MEHEFSLETGTAEHYTDPLLYEHEYRIRIEDIAFYREAAQTMLDGPGDLLELACGSGRLSRALVTDGHSVLGLDLSRSMLAHACRARRELAESDRARLKLFCADMRDFQVGRKFDLIIMGFNAFEHLYTNDDVTACLSRVREHLAPGGTFVFDVHHPDPELLARGPDDRSEGIEFIHPVSKTPFEYSTAAYYDRARRIAFIRIYYRPLGGGREQVVRLAQRRFFPEELRHLLEVNGFHVALRFGDFDYEEFASDSPWQVLMCRAN